MVTPGASHHLRGGSMSPAPQAVKAFLTLLFPVAEVQVTSLICTTYAMADLIRQVVSNGKAKTGGDSVEIRTSRNAHSRMLVVRMVLQSSFAKLK